MYQGKRYTDGKYGVRKRPNIFLRVIISLSVAVIISFGLIMLGSRLGEKVPEELVPETTSPETTARVPSFHFKEVEPRTVSDIAALPLFGEDIPDAVVLDVSDENGKLNCITSINSLLYGGAVSSELRPIEALLYEAKQKAGGVSVRFTPFVSDTSQDYADLCSAAVVGALSAYEIDEIVLCLDNTSPTLAERLKQSAGNGVKVGGAVSLSVLSNETLLREYYKVLDFIVLDLSGLDITSYKGEESTSSTEPQDVTETEESVTAPTIPEQSVESVLSEHSLSIIKYSVRLRVTCKDENDLSAFLEFYRSFGLCGYEAEAMGK